MSDIRPTTRSAALAQPCTILKIRLKMPKLSVDHIDQAIIDHAMNDPLITSDDDFELPDTVPIPAPRAKVTEDIVEADTAVAGPSTSRRRRCSTTSSGHQPPPPYDSLPPTPSKHAKKKAKKEKAASDKPAKTKPAKTKAPKVVAVKVPSSDTDTAPIIDIAINVEVARPQEFFVRGKNKGLPMPEVVDQACAIEITSETSWEGVLAAIAVGADTEPELLRPDTFLWQPLRPKLAFRPMVDATALRLAITQLRPKPAAKGKARDEPTLFMVLKMAQPNPKPLVPVCRTNPLRYD